jgi:hypothetical protein
MHEARGGIACLDSKQKQVRYFPATSWPLPQARLFDLPGSTCRRPGSPVLDLGGPVRPRNGLCRDDNVKQGRRGRMPGLPAGRLKAPATAGRPALRLDLRQRRTAKDG